MVSNLRGDLKTNSQNDPSVSKWSYTVGLDTNGLSRWSHSQGYQSSFCKSPASNAFVFGIKLQFGEQFLEPIKPQKHFSFTLIRFLLVNSGLTGFILRLIRSWRNFGGCGLLISHAEFWLQGFSRSDFRKWTKLWYN